MFESNFFFLSFHSGSLDGVLCESSRQSQVKYISLREEKLITLPRLNLTVFTRGTYMKL